MTKKLLIFFFIGLCFFAGFYYSRYKQNPTPYGAPPYIEGDDIVPPGLERFPDILNWKRPEGPLRVGLQAGHWKNNELPDEFKRLRESGGGTRSSGGIPEWEAVLKIAEETKKILEKEGVVVDILPATIPPSYWADAFVSLHADGSTSPQASGFKLAAPRRDFTGKARHLVEIFEKTYGETTKLPLDPNVTRNMRGYYAFAWWRYDHAVHPMTPAVILETGFLTNPIEARMLINQPEIPAQAIADTLLQFLSK